MTWTRSLLRDHEHALLGRLVLDGRILDVGGSKKSGYQELIGGVHEFVTANIDASYDADLLFDAEEMWPIKDASFDGVLMINVLEHLYHYERALKEARRVLTEKGTFVGCTPFMFNVHGSPNDYFRYTESALRRMFADAGFTRVEVYPLGTGAFSVMYHCMVGLMRWKWLAALCKRMATGLDGLVARVRPHNSVDAVHMPLGYYFIARP